MLCDFGLLDIIGVHYQDECDNMVAKLLPEIFPSVLPKDQTRNCLEPDMCLYVITQTASTRANKSAMISRQAWGLKCHLDVVPHLCTVQQPETI